MSRPVAYSLFDHFHFRFHIPLIHNHGCCYYFILVLHQYQPTTTTTTLLWAYLSTALFRTIMSPTLSWIELPIHRLWFNRRQSNPFGASEFRPFSRTSVLLIITVPLLFLLPPTLTSHHHRHHCSSSTLTDSDTQWMNGRLTARPSANHILTQ